MIKTIKCPYCGYEYLPGEIYVPNNFLGKPNKIIRDEGKIYSFEGIQQDLTESYICDNCNKNFLVIAKVTFETHKDPKETFEEEYISSI